jgi:adenosylcobinamide-GDP ribazoletransferase
MPHGFRVILQQLAAAVVFYTILPIARNYPLEFRGMAMFAPFVGCLIGILLALVDGICLEIGLSESLRSVLLVTSWIVLTGGLHLDGAMDTADGLAVMDPERRLRVMADSRSGAFAVMAASVLIAIKIAALGDLPYDRAWILSATAGWARWGQLFAILRYPYLKPRGKGAFHKEGLTSAWQALPGLLGLIALGGLWWLLSPLQLVLAVGLTIGGAVISVAVAAWFNRQLGGQTGDSYGAIVEWTEALMLILSTMLD